MTHHTAAERARHSHATGVEMTTHLNEHINWPATGSEIVQTCNNMSDVPEAERKTVTAKLNPGKTYRSAEDAMKDIEKQG